MIVGVSLVAGAFSWLGTLADRLGEWANSHWFVYLIAAIAFFDAVLPIVPSETALIIGGVAVSTDAAPYGLLSVIVAGAIGAFLGDNLAYLLGRRFAAPIERYAARHPRLAGKLAWAERQLTARGGPLLVTARFIPGGRTALTLANGIMRRPHATFAAWVGFAAVVWAVFGAGLARLVGEPFRDNHRAAFFVAFGTAIGVNLLIELVRHLRSRRRARAQGSAAALPGPER